MSQDFWTPNTSSPSIGRVNIKELEVQVLPDSSFEVEVTQHFDAEVILDTEAGNQIRALMTGTLSATTDRSDPMPWVPENCRMPVKTSPNIPPIRFLKIPENLVDAETEEPIKPLPLSQKIKAELTRQMEWREAIIEVMPEITIDTIEDVLDAAAAADGEPLPELTDVFTSEAPETEHSKTPDYQEEEGEQLTSDSEGAPLENAEEAESDDREDSEIEGRAEFSGLDDMDEELDRIMKDIEKMAEPTDDMPAPTDDDDIQEARSMATWAESEPSAEQEPSDDRGLERMGEIDSSDDWASKDEDELKLADDTATGTTSEADDDDEDLLRFDDEDFEEEAGDEPEKGAVQGPSLTSFAEPEPAVAEPELKEAQPVGEGVDSNEYRTIVLKNDCGVDLGIRAGIHCGKVVRAPNGLREKEAVYELYKSRAGHLIVHENESQIHEISVDNCSELFDLLGYDPDAKEAYERAGVNCIRWID